MGEILYFPVSSRVKSIVVVGSHQSSKATVPFICIHGAQAIIGIEYWELATHEGQVGDARFFALGGTGLLDGFGRWLVDPQPGAFAMGSLTSHVFADGQCLIASEAQNLGDDGRRVSKQACGLSRRDS